MLVEVKLIDIANSVMIPVSSVLELLIIVMSAKMMMPL